MVELQENWLTEGLLDSEYKKYLLLAYLQQTEQQFQAKMLYPKLSELIAHYRNLEHFQKQKQVLEQGFPKEISALDFEKLQVKYSSLLQDDALVRELEEVVDFALVHFKKQMAAGKELYEEVEQQVEIFPVGIVPLYTQEGYFFLTDFWQRLVRVYFYQISIFESALEKFRGIRAQLVQEYNLRLTDTYEQVKSTLINRHGLPAPATYALEFKASFPLSETMLPVAKRMLLRYLSPVTPRAL